MRTHIKTSGIVTVLACTLVCLLAVTTASAQGAPGSRGAHGCAVGVHFWRNIDDGGLNRVPEDGAAWVAGYQYRVARLLALQSDLEMYPRHFIASESKVYAPVVYLLAGAGLYGGLGTGTYISGGQRSQSPFYVTRAGLELKVVPQASIDFSLNYRVPSWRQMGSIFDDWSLDSVTAAVMVRYGL